MHHSFEGLIFRITIAFAAATLMLVPSAAQETRGSIHGRVTDPSGAAVPGVTVTVDNLDMNTSTTLTTNQTGYYEASLLIAGNYRVSAQFAGFKKTVRSGLLLPLSGNLDIGVKLEVGEVADSVSVTAESPVLDTSTASSGRVLDNRSVMDLPVIANNVMVLVKMTPGLFTGGVNDYLGPHSISGASDYSTGAGVGGNEWSIDGVPSNGASRQTAYLPHEDTVQEMRIETSNFDVSVGHGTLANITLMTKAGGSRYHGTVTEQHWQQSWQAIAAFTAPGPVAPGHSNNYVGAFGGPVWIPKVYKKSNRFFFFFSYQRNKDHVADLPTRVNTTIPTMSERKGDFSTNLKLGAQYQLYDPLSVRVDPARSGHFIRDAMPGNLVPQSRMINPTLAAYLKVLPVTNNERAGQDSNNDYLSGAPLVRDYAAYSNRIDLQASDRSRFYARWTYNHWANYAADWTYTTVPGLQSLAQLRRNLGATVDWTYTLGSNTVLNAAVALNNYQDGNNPTAAQQYKPSDVGLPAYLDQKAGDRHILPVLNLAGYNSISVTYPAITSYRTASGKADLTHVRGSHTLRGGYDMRMQYRTGGGGGNTSGTFSYDNAYVRKNDDTNTPAASLGLSWAAFLMGIPSTMNTSLADSYALMNPYYAWYGQDNWRLTPKLSVTFGLRMEYELGPRERYNRVLAGFDPTAALPIASAAQAAYTRNPVPELSASNFVVQGGSVYAGAGGASRRLWNNQVMWLPRVSAAYQLSPKTVLRAGYGIFYDTLNVLNQGGDQTGYSRTTSTTLTNNFGVNWLVGNPAAGISPLTDPFPVRATGTRFDVPTGNALGSMATVGRGFSYYDADYRHARLQRWRIAVQRQIAGSTTIEAAYGGQRAGDISVSQSQSPLPGQYWNTGTVRNTTLAGNLTANVSNPFNIANFTALQSSAPLLYTNMSTLGFFTGSTVQKQVLLRAFPQMNGLTRSNSPLGGSRTDSLEIVAQRRLAKGFNLNAGYTRMRARASDYFYNEFDSAPGWRESNDARPYRFTAGGIVELPFGKGRALARSGLPNYLFGGFQIALTYELAPGPLLAFGNLFYYGKLSDIAGGPHTLDQWFNTASFERDTAKMAAAYQARVFPTFVDGVRGDRTNQWNSNVQRDFRIREGVSLQLRGDALNLANRSQYAAPNVNPSNTNFGRVTSQSNTTKRFLQIQARLRF